MSDPKFLSDIAALRIDRCGLHLCPRVRDRSPTPLPPRSFAETLQSMDPVAPPNGLRFDLTPGGIKWVRGMNALSLTLCDAQEPLRRDHRCVPQGCVDIRAAKWCRQPASSVDRPAMK